MSRRLRVRPYTWNRGQEDATPGVLLSIHRGRVIGHFTIEEARKAADDIHEACDAAEQQKQEKDMTAPTDLPEFLTGPDFGARIKDLEALAVSTDAVTKKEDEK